MMTLSPLIAPATLADRLAQPSSCVIVDCRFSLQAPEQGEQAYRESHVPGAVYLSLDRDLAAPVAPNGQGGRHPLPTIAAMEALWSRLGIERGVTEVYVYDDSRFAFAARLWWMLRYCGHDRVFVLDGGFSGWVAAGWPVTSSMTEPVTNQSIFVAQVQPNWTVDREQVLTADASVAVVDSRSPDRYRGAVEPIDPYAGHVPGAVNYFWQGVTDDRGFAKSPEVQRQRWQGLGDRDRAIVYCGSGVTACVNLLSLELARQVDPDWAIAAQLYPGSWSDWCAFVRDDRDPLIARSELPLDQVSREINQTSNDH